MTARPFPFEGRPGASQPLAPTFGLNAGERAGTVYCKTVPPANGGRGHSERGRCHGAALRWQSTNYRSPATRGPIGPHDRLDQSEVGREHATERHAAQLRLQRHSLSTWSE